MTTAERLEAAAARLEQRASHREAWAGSRWRWLTTDGLMARHGEQRRAVEERAMAALLRAAVTQVRHYTEETRLRFPPTSVYGTALALADWVLS